MKFAIEIALSGKIHQSNKVAKLEFGSNFIEFGWGSIAMSKPQNCES